MIQTFRQNVTAASINGNPWESWAGPISIATGVEYRSESVRGDATAEDLAGQYFAGNYKPTFGKYNVKEMFVETLIPLAADQAWAKSLDFNAAVRETDYSTSGAVTTWKAGFTYKPFNDRHGARHALARHPRAEHERAVQRGLAREQPDHRQQDRAFSISMKAPRSAIRTSTPRKRTRPVRVSSTSRRSCRASARRWTTGTSICKDAIGTISAQQIVDQCTVKGRPEFCSLINGGLPLGQIPRDAILVQPLNLAEQKVRGIDLDMSYRTALSDLVSGAPGNLTLRALGTHYIKNYTDNTITLPTDTAGQNTGGGPASWRWNTSLTYEPAVVQWHVQCTWRECRYVRQQPDRVHLGLSGLHDRFPDDQREPHRRGDLLRRVAELHDDGRQGGRHRSEDVLQRSEPHQQGPGDRRRWPERLAVRHRDHEPGELRHAGSSVPARSEGEVVMIGSGKLLLGSVALATLLGLAGCSGGTGEPEGSASPLRVRLLSAKQYTQSVSYLFGADVADAVPAPLPPLARTSGLLASGAASIGVTSDQLQQIQTAASGDRREGGG